MPNLKVVIDPDDREQVEDFFRLVLKNLPRYATHRDYCDAIQAALQFLASPKIPEPMNWLAAVEDIDGVRWFTHRSSKDVPWKNPWYSQDYEEYRDYADIDACKIISEGIDE